jgi:MoxR-like ATPase
MDRFMLKLKIGYPSRAEEREIMDRVDMLHPAKISAVITKKQILKAREIVNQIYVDDKAKNYIVDLVYATREPEVFGLQMKHLIEYGASPRATIYLQQAARALAFLQGEGNVFPNDVKQVAIDVLRHRVKPTYEAEAENITSEDLIRRILETVPVP